MQWSLADNQSYEDGVATELQVDHVTFVPRNWKRVIVRNRSWPAVSLERQ